MSSLPTLVTTTLSTLSTAITTAVTTTLAPLITTTTLNTTTTLAPTTAAHHEHHLPIDVLVGEIAEKTHQTDSKSLLILVWLLVLTVLTIWAFRKRRVRFLHETGVSLFMGMIAGGAIYGWEKDHQANFHEERLFICNASNALSGADVEVGISDVTRFDPELFFLLLLPPIICNAGWTCDLKNFFKNIGAIFSFALIGTTVACFITGSMVWAYSAYMHDVGITLSEGLLFGALISATDPVTILAIFHDLHVDVTLFALVFGESVMNDAVSIVLYSTIEKFRASDASVTVQSILFSVLTFFIIFVGSFACGMVMGMITAFLAKFTKVKKFPLLETTFVLLISYSSFLLGEAFGLTGIVSVLFCGISQRHYTYPNLSEESQRRVSDFLELLNMMAENFIFSYIGLSFFLYQCHIWDFGLIFWTLFACVLARIVHVIPISYFCNKFRSATQKITPKFQFMLVFSGLRGAIAFALAIRNTASDAKKILLTTTLCMVLITVVCFGGTTMTMLQKLRIRVNVHPEDEEDDEEMDLAPPPSGKFRLQGFVSRLWVALDDGFLLPVLAKTPDNDGTESWTSLKRIIVGFVRNEREDFLPPGEVRVKPKKLTHTESSEHANFEADLSLLDKSIAPEDDDESLQSAH